MEDMFIFDVIVSIVQPYRRNSENVMLISLLQVCQKGGGGKKVGTLRTFWRHRRQGHSFMSNSILFDPEEETMKVFVNIFIRTVS